MSGLLPWCFKTITSDVVQDLDSRGRRRIAPNNKLSVLYIEENTEDQLILRRALKKSINTDIKFDTAATAKIGMRKINTNDYDLIFLDYRLPDKTGLEFLEEIREKGKTVPVIFLTGMGNERIAVQTIRADVQDYIIKSEIHTNEFIDTIRKRLIEETDKRWTEVELSGLEEEALRELEGNEVSEILLETDEGMIYYAGMRRFTEAHGIEVTSLILETLAEKGVIRETDNRRIVICPICDSAVTAADRSNYACPKCMSKKFVRVKFLSHPFCGFTGDRRTFVTEMGLVCPNCKVELMIELDSSISMDRDGYYVLGNSFECDACETKFNRPEMVHSCVRCGEDFNYKTMDYVHLREYRVV